MTSETLLYRVLRQAQNTDVDLSDLLRELDETEVKSREEAEAICELLASSPTDRSKSSFSQLHALTGLFQDVASEEAFQPLRDRGIPQLCRIYDELSPPDGNGDVDDLMFVLKILAMYRTSAGTDRVIAAARQPLQPDDYMWSIIFEQYHDEHPHHARLLDALRTPLPSGFLAVALLDCANAYAIGGAEGHHPFDSAAGKQKLRAWLSNADRDEFSYAHSATASLPFISNPERDQLLALAMDHPDTNVQLEAAWASAKLGSEAGLKVLVRYSRDPKHSSIACRYLSELGHEDAIPEETRDPDFAAMAEFANWLAHPTELGRAPDAMEIVDRRELAWPPDGEERTLWLIKYRAEDAESGDVDEDCGLVGSTTFCLFSYKIGHRPPEDAYAIHCAWEMQTRNLIKEYDRREIEERFADLVNQWPSGRLERAKLVHVAELSPELRYPQEVVGLARARINGEKGWAALDGARSAWYPKADMPADVHDSAVLKLHIGRGLLGFSDQPDRKAYLR